MFFLSERALFISDLTESPTLIAQPVGRGNGAMLVLSAAFDTIDHDNLFCILEKYVGICGNALKLMKSYFSNRTQRVQIDVLSDFAKKLFVVFLKAQS